MIVIRKPLELFADMPCGTVFGYSGTFLVKMKHPVVSGDATYHAFDLQQSCLFSMPKNARGFVVEGHFVEGAKPQ